MYILVGCLAGGHALAAADEYDFDVASFHKKSWEFGGFVEMKGEHFKLDPDTAASRLRFADEPGQTIDRVTGTVELEALVRHGLLTSWARTHSELQHDDYLGDEQSHKLYEAVVSLQPDPGRVADIGKQVARWGKGYAWNPVGFIERPKDPDDPTLAREGYWMLRGDWIKSFSGGLQTLAITPALVPVAGDMNDDFGEPSYLNPAAKLYLLYHDTDLDFLFLGQGSRSARFGLDFSRNLAANFEIHGELAYLTESERKLLTPTGITTESDPAVNYLLGLRYLTPHDITIIGEYYRNGTGYSPQELEEFYRQVHRASGAGDTGALSELKQLSKSSYGRPNPGREYLYLRGAWKEPFDLLYFTPSIISIVNLEDSSFSLTPELLYKGIHNLELRLRLKWINGGHLTEFGEKQNDYKVEFRLRYYF